MEIVTKSIDLSEVLEYNVNSPSCLTWKITVNTNAQAGDAAGTLDKNGYWIVRYKGKGYKAHRVVLLLHGIPIEKQLTDHIDGDRANNVLSNLRVVSAEVNPRNAAKNKKNTSGVTGVSRCQMKHHEYWCAIWYTSKIHYKRFNIATYGDQEAKQLAIEYREAKILELNKAGYGYTERHGT